MAASPWYVTFTPMKTPAKVALTLCLVGGGVAYMIFTTISSGQALEYFKHVDEVMLDPGKWKEQRLQVHGNVVQGSILRKPKTLDFKFAIHHKGAWLEVLYSGIVPDNFKDCSELVVKGSLQTGRTFKARELSAKCPSKYDDRRAKGCGETLLPKVMAHRQEQ